MNAEHNRDLEGERKGGKGKERRKREEEEGGLPRIDGTRNEVSLRGNHFSTLHPVITSHYRSEEILPGVDFPNAPDRICGRVCLFLRFN